MDDVNCLQTGSWADGGESPTRTFPGGSTILALSRSDDQANTAVPSLQILPADAVRRQGAAWGSLSGEVIQVTQPAMFAMEFCGPFHLLMAFDRGERHDGDTYLDGLPRSSLRDVSQKLTFVPAGLKFREWQVPRIMPRLTCLYLDPRWSLTEGGAGPGGEEVEARLFFHDPDIWATAYKLRRQIERADGADRLYVDALGLVLMRELLRLSHMPETSRGARPGGLAAWQSKRTAEYIEAHLSDQISLTTLSDIAQLSPFHFTRAFKQSFGIPPHRYHTARRIERAKALLARESLSVTWIAMELGFADTSCFSTAFRRLVGRTPSCYRRSLI